MHIAPRSLISSSAALLLWLALAGAAGTDAPAPTDVRAETGRLAISKLPKIDMHLDRKLKYLGAVPFDIRGIAGGYRYVWAEVDEQRRARRVFIVQREGYYSNSSGRYTYPADNPVTIGGQVYDHNLYLYDNDVAAARSPGAEPSLTKDFFVQRKIRWDPQTVMSRFARIVDAGGQNEIIFF